MEMKAKKRKPLTTSIEEDILYRFKVRCAENEKKMNEVLEVLMEEYLEKGKEGGAGGIPNR